MYAGTLILRALSRLVLAFWTFKTQSYNTPSKMMKCILAALLLVAVAAQASSAPLVDQVKLTSLLDLIQARNLTDLKLANFTVLQQPCLMMTNVYCMDVYDPVCGSDGVTYSNSCTMSQNTCRQVTVAYKGACGSIAK